MVSYQVNGKIYDLPEEEVQGFLEEFPNAVIVEEDETVEKPIPSPEESAPVGENAALDNTVSEPVDTSLELPVTYKVDGKIYDLPKEEVAGFLNTFPEAVPYKETSIEAVDNLIEEPKEKDEEVKYESVPQYIYENIVDFVQDLGDAWQNGVLQGEQTDKGIELAGYFNDPATEKEVVDWIDGQKKVAQQNIQSAEMREFDRIYEEAGGGMWGFLKGAAYNPSVLSTTLLSSIASQFSSIKNSEEVAAAATAGAIAGSAFTPVGTLIGVTTGSMAMMEAGLTFNELMMEEIGGDINDPGAKEKIKAVLNDPEKMADLRQKAGLRGAVIAGVELATLGMARGVAGKLASKALPITGLAAGGAVEIVGGGLGEVGGRLAAGQEMDAKEIGFEAFAGLGSAPISLGSQALKLQTAIQTAEAGKKVRASDFNSLTEVYSNENSNSETAIEISKLSKSVKIVDREVDEKVNSGEFTQEEGDNIKRNFRDTQGAVNRIKPLNFNPKQETKAVELLKEKQQLLNEIKEVNEKALTQPQQERVDAIDKELNDLRVERATETITEAVDLSRVILVENDQELQDKYNIKGANYSAAGGFFKDGKFYINKEVAGQFETITEPSHELLHPILKEALKANPQELVDEFKKVIGEDNVRAVQKRIDGIEIYTDEYMQANPDEFITQFGDMILEGEITYNDNIFTKIGDYITPLLRKFGFKKIKFDSGRDVYNFMREYSKGIERGKLSEDVKAVIPEELQTPVTKEKVNKTEVVEEERLKDNQVIKSVELFEVVLFGGSNVTVEVRTNLDGSRVVRMITPDGVAQERVSKDNSLSNKDYVTKAYGAIQSSKSKPIAKVMSKKKIDRLSTRQKEAIGLVDPPKSTTKKSKDSGAAFSVKDKTSVLEAINKLVPQDITTQEEYQSFINDRRAFPKLYNAINEQGGVINNYIKSISTTPEEAQKTIENLTNRILKFNPEAKRKDGTSVGIKAFGERIFADIQFARKGSKLELYEESEKTKRESRREDREDGFETLAAPETEIETTPAPPARGRKLVKKQALSEENQKALEKVVAEADFTEEQLTFKTLPNAAIEIFAKEIGIPAKKFAGSSNFTQDELGKVITYIEENIDIIRQALPQAAVLEGAPVSESLIGTATGVPNNLLKDPNLYTRKERTTKKAGIVPYEKNKGIDNSSILKAIGIIDGKRTAGPRDKQAQTAKGLINVLAKFATNQEVRLQKNLTPQQQTNIETGKGSQVLFSAKNISKEERNKRNKILINESTKAFEGNPSFDEYLKRIRPVLQDNKVTKALSDSSNKAFRGNIYEYYIWERLNSLNINGLKLMPPEYGTGTDIKATFFDQPFDLEVKLNLQDAFGAPTIYFDSGKNKWSFDESNLDQEIFDIVEKNIDQQKVNNFLTEIQKLGAYSLNESGNKKEKVDFTLRIPAESYKENKNKSKTGKIDKLTASVYKKIAGKQLNKQEKQSLNNAIIEYYNKKGINYIVVDNQMYYLKENPLQLPINQLTGDVYIKFRIKPGGKKSNKKLGDFYNLMAATQFGMDKATSKGTPLNKAFQTKLSKSISKAEIKNNKELPKKFQLPKGSTNEQVLAKMRELDDQANEERAAFSVKQNLDEAFNDIIEAKTGIETYKRFSPAKAEVRGASKGKFNFFIPPSAEDFTGLLYKTLAKGKIGDKQMQWYKDNLLDPYARAMNDISSARVALFEDYKTLKKDLKIIPKDLKKKGFDEYTNEQAVRIYIWDKQGDNIPGLYKTDRKELVDYINNNPELKLFADQLIAIQKGDQYSKPKEGWLAGTITTDLLDGVNSIKRKKYLEQWQNNVDEIFSEVNMNKLEAAFGKPYRNALENILTRMKTGRNKPFTSDSLAGRVTDWLNNSVGAIMFFNTRSAVLQTISSINFINWGDNNIYKAGKAFANQPQYWKDFKFLFNSDFLKERRGGLRFNVSESEIADAAKKGGVRGVVSKILQAGFLPTQMADSFAIATGGATFYRNRVDAYVKQGMDVKEAQDKAFQDFREIAEESQQSSRPDRISAQQAGPLGRTILAFANTPAQYARLTKKAASDLINGRGDAKTNISKLLYYGAVQNLIFNALQQALFAIAFGDEEDEEKKDEKYLSVANGMADGLLRGIGLQGAIISTLKNTLLKIIKESEKSRPDYAETTMVQLLGISPPIQSKAQKIRSAMKSYEWNKKEMLEKGFSLDNPAYLAGANVISASTNVPLDRVIKKVDNVRSSTREDLDVWQRMMLLAGWSDWQLGIQKTKTKAKTRGRTRGRQRKTRTRE